MNTYVKLALLPLLLVFAACGGDDDGGGPSEAPPTPNPWGLESAAIATAANPVAIAFAPDGRIFFAEKFTGVIRVIGADGQVQEEPFADLDVAEWLGLDWGVTGMAIDPDFDANPYLYVFYTEPVNRDPERPTARPVLVRIEASGNVGDGPDPVIDDFPETRLDHQGFKTNGGLEFGPDDNLYLTMGDYDYGMTDGPGGEPPAQDLGEVMGKVLRVTRTGAAAANNPFASTAGADPRVFAYGFASGSDLAFAPNSGDPYNADATDSCEEINAVIPGGDFGWPDVGEFPFPDCNFGDQVKAIHLLARPGTVPGQFQSYVGVSGAAYLDGNKYPALGTGLLVCEKETGQMRRLVLAPDGRSVTADDVALTGCIGSVAVSPDGTIYYTNGTEVRVVSQASPSSVTPTGTASP
jgi:glucose/arabinose dehydrogenase